MPLLFKKDLGGAILSFWEIKESERDLIPLVTNADRLSSLRYNNYARKVQHLAWRAALRTINSDVEIFYEAGTMAPVVEGGGYYVSSAHTEGAAVALLAERRCGVDIENLGRDFSKAARRFISAEETGLGSSCDPRFPAAVWCAKEAMYKYAAREGVDFLRDMRITSANLEGGTMTGELKGVGQLQISLIYSGEYIISVIA